MVELVDTPDLGSGAERCGGSSPPSRTMQSIESQGLRIRKVNAVHFCNIYSGELLQ